MGVVGTVYLRACVGHVCFCCAAKVVQPTRVSRYGEELPRSARQAERAGTRSEEDGVLERAHRNHGENITAQKDFAI